MKRIIYIEVSDTVKCSCPNHKGEFGSIVKGDHALRKGTDVFGRAKYWCKACVEGR